MTGICSGRLLPPWRWLPGRGGANLTAGSRCRRDIDPALSQRLQQQLDRFNASSRLAYDLSLSVGIVGYDFTSPLTLEQMVVEADQALYVRKRGRRSSARIRTPAAS